MIRSNFAIARLIILPYSALLVLHLMVVGGGGVWLYFQERTLETRMLISNMASAIDPLAEKLRAVDAQASMRDGAPWLVNDVRMLFAQMPALRNISVRGTDRGYQMEKNTDGLIISRDAEPLPATVQRATGTGSEGRRLFDETDALFVIRFDVSRAGEPLTRLEFSFDRNMLRKSVDEGLVNIKQTIQSFVVAGAVSILIALVITVVAMRTTRRLESHFQGIYQRAALTETAAQLVHDLRNHLASLRANIKALVVSPQQTQAIVSDMDRAVVSLNDKLNTFLDLTRPYDEAFVPVDIGAMVDEAVRLAGPVLEKHGLSVETVVPPALLQPIWQKVAMRDALLNVIVNAAQSGQRDGAVRVVVDMDKGMVQIAVEDQGKGIEQRHLPYLFEAFYTTREEGNGLGLAIVKRVVAAHQGRVYAENRRDGGARVVLVVPLQRKEPPAWWNKFKKTSPV